MSKFGKISYFVAALILILALVVRFMIPGMPIFYVALGLAAAAVIIAIVVDYKFYFEFFAMKTTKHGMNMGVIIVLALVLIVAINFLGVQFDKTFDLTKEKLNSLSDQSLSTLSSLKDDLQILIFFRGTEDKENRVKLKGNFQIYQDSSPHVKIQMVDALLDQEMAKKYLEHQRFAVFVDYQGKKIQVQEPYDEEKTTSAILKAMSKEQKTIYFLVGHGERDIDAADEESLKQLAEALRSDGYSVAKINLTGGDKLPAPPAVVVIAGPKQPFLDAELNLLRDYAKAGGHLMITGDPGEKHNLPLLTKSFGVEFHNNYVINQHEQIQGMGPLASFSAEFDRVSEITKKFNEGGSQMRAIFMIASEVTKAADASADLNYKDLVKSSPRAYTNATANSNPNATPHAVVMAVSVQGTLDKDPKAKDDDLKKNFEAVVFGDSDFMSNHFLPYGVDRDLALNAISYLADDANHISIRPKTPESTPLAMTEAKEIIFSLAAYGLPLLLVILSGFFWYRRRNL